MTALAAIHVALKQLGIEPDDARDLYERQTGKRSLKQMAPRELEAIVGELRRLGFKPAKKGLEGPFAKQLQALWIDAYHLGLVHDRRDSALFAFVRRQTGIEHMRWLIDAEDASKVTEALKGWMAREAGVDWSVGNHVPDWYCAPGAKVVVAQWNMLANAGQEKRDFAAFKAFVEDHAFNPLTRMKAKEWAGVMRTLGARVRRVKR